MTAPPRPDLDALPELPRLLVRKLEMEAALVADPADVALRQAYFALLATLSDGRTGLAHALLPELGQPLYFRGGSRDLARIAEVFRDDAHDFALRATPRRILDLGAGCGYAAVALALRFPEAELLCVEPNADDVRLLRLNTAPYRRIGHRHAAAWHSATRLAASDGGGGPCASPGVAAYPVDMLLEMAGWSGAELVRCDLNGAEAAVFADPRARWLRHLDVLAVETRGRLAAGPAQRVAAAFDPAVFGQSSHGDIWLFQRHVPLRALPQPRPRAQLLVEAGPGLFPFTLEHVAALPAGCLTRDGDSFQLRPNPPGEPPARAIFPRTLAGHTRLSARLHHDAGAGAGGRRAGGSIAFVGIVQDEDGSELFRAERRVAPRQQDLLELRWPALTGRHRIVLQCELSPDPSGETAGIARWVRPGLD